MSGVQELDGGAATVADVPASRKTLNELAAMVFARDTAADKILELMIRAKDEGASYEEIRQVTGEKSRQTVLNKINAARRRLSAGGES